MTMLDSLSAGQPIVFGGNRLTHVSSDLAAAFVPGDRLVVVQRDGALLHIPAQQHSLVDAAVSSALVGFRELTRVSDDAITLFFDRFAALLADDVTFAPIAAANVSDIDDARKRGRSTTRLVLDRAMRADMIRGLRGWRDASGARDIVLDSVTHDGWLVEARRAPLGVVGFVFEGRPNVFADACGVVRTGNAVVFRIGSDALGTARAIVEHALGPALGQAGLPAGVVQLVDSAEHSAGHALFADPRLALAVARGSGAAVAQLGAVASQAGTPVSLHGTGGAWLVVGSGAIAEPLRDAVVHSLDRKVCNTLNVVAITRQQAEELVPVVLDALAKAASRRGSIGRLHVVEGSEVFVPPELFDQEIR
jgi:glutamate-5-semialdehyde dehydrogenase